MVTMGNQPTACDRVDAAYGKLQGYFTSGPTKNTAKISVADTTKGPASITTEVLVTRTIPMEFKRSLKHKVDTDGDRRDDSDLVFDVLHRAAHEWHTEEVTDKARANLKKRRTANANGKSMSGGGPGVHGTRSTLASSKVC